MTRFQERLWGELVRDHAATLAYPVGLRAPLPALPIAETRPSRLRARSMPSFGALLRRPGRLAASAAVLAAAIALSVIFSTAGTSPSAAYAVTQNPDGTITVSISELTGVTGANAQLSRLGVRVRVVPVQPDCSEQSSAVAIPGALAAQIAHAQSQGLAIRPELVPMGDTLVLTARQATTTVGLGYALYRGTAPTCISQGEDHAG